MLQFGASLTDNTRGVNYDRNTFIIQATDYKNSSITHEKSFITLVPGGKDRSGISARATEVIRRLNVEETKKKTIVISIKKHSKTLFNIFFNAGVCQSWYRLSGLTCKEEPPSRLTRLNGLPMLEPGNTKGGKYHCTVDLLFD
jgi:hypothetical protein